MRTLHGFPFLLIVSAIGCNSPKMHGKGSASHIVEPVAQTASMRDTFPEKFFRRINPREKQGIVLAFRPGESTAYFEYEADPKVVLSVIADLPFSAYGHVADTCVLPVQSEGVLNGANSLSNQQQLSTAFFFDNDLADFDAYECRKPPFRHFILVQKGTHRILHKIERTI
jgi:hypothetical protein